MPITFSPAGYATLDAVAARGWCERHTDAFIRHLIDTVSPEELTQAITRRTAKEYISAQEDIDLAQIRRRAESSPQLSLDLVIDAMADYLLALTLAGGKK